MVIGINVSDFDGLMQLYTHLNDNPITVKDNNIIALWNRILQTDLPKRKTI